MPPFPGLWALRDRFDVGLNVCDLLSFITGMAYREPLGGKIGAPRPYCQVHMSKTITSEVIWQPSGKYLESRVSDFMRLHGLTDWRELVAKSNDDTDWFWSNCMEFMGVQWHKPYTRLMNSDKGFPWTTWFDGGELNIAANILDFHMEAGKQAGDRTSVGKDHPAMIWEGEDGRSRNLTYGELNKLSGQVAQCLLKLNVKAGDAVGVYMPMIPEVVAVLFGCLKIGAVAVPVFSGYGPHPLAARLNDAKARILFTADAGKRRGRFIAIKSEADEALKNAPVVEHVIVVKHCDTGAPMQNGRDLWFDEAVTNQEPAPTVVNLPAEHPAMYLYTSGTTGKPKGTVHTHGGALAQIALRSSVFAFDVRANDVFFWVTDIGWMMGPWEMIGTMFWGATMVVFEGHPAYPDPDAIWQIVNRHNVTTLGISPTLIRQLKSQGDEWVDKHESDRIAFTGQHRRTLGPRYIHVVF